MQKFKKTVDSFGTYLKEVSGDTNFEKIVQRVRTKPVKLGQLVQEFDATPEDVVSVLVKAESLGMVRLEKDGDDTIASAFPPAV
jgi:predicted Rossmann fold nucleotide-binding protein DprA/Smf involved in DNA uptake